MKGSLLAAVLAALVLAATTTAVAVARPATTPKKVPKPTATITFSSAVTVAGKNFKKKEKVTVSLSSTTTSEKWTKKATASTKGVFKVSFGAIDLNSCAQYTLKIVGSLKSRFSTSHPFVPC